MALSPENRATLRAIKHPAHLNMNGLEYWAEGNGNVVNTLMSAARSEGLAQGRASLEERVRLLEEALAGVQPWAEMGLFLRDNQSSAYGDRYSQPEELTIQWEWQQSTPDDYGDASLRNDIDGWLEGLLEDASPEVLEHPVVKARALLATPGERGNG